MVRDENFLKRWSRLKREGGREEPGDAPERDLAIEPGGASPPAAAPGADSAPAAPSVTEPGAAPAPEVPPVDSLQGLASDYRAFLNPQVDEGLRRTALKKLFHDPHFNVMDGLDVYIDDYSKPDPIPESMLKTLLHARGLLFPEETEPPVKAGEDGERVPDAAAAAPSPADPRPLPEASSENAIPDEVPAVPDARREKG